MIRIFRKHSTHLKTNWFNYALDTVVVIIGILIALGANNWNDKRINRANEIHYLKNIKKDLILNIAHLEDYLKTRSSQIESATITLEHFEGKPITDLEAYNAHTINVYTWKKFFQINNTFKELMNSGNLAIISNDSIKNNLLNLESQYKILKAEEAHFRYDSEVAMYQPAYQTQDFNKLIKNFTYYLSKGQAGENVEITAEDFSAHLKDLNQKNGFVMAVFEFSTMNEQMKQMKKISEYLIELINNELKEV